MIDVDFVTEYEINRYTMAIFPVKKDGKLYSKVLEVDRSIYVSLSPFRIVENSCSYYGVPFVGRKDGARLVAGFTRKSPITIDQINDLYFFPTVSPKNDECCWISLHYVLNMSATPLSTTYVEFSNKEEVEVPISFSSFETQLHRTAFLRTKMLHRVNGPTTTNGLDYHDLVAAPPPRFSYRPKKR